MSEQATERYCVLVNGHAVEPGCWVDGHWGQYGPDHLADRAEELGWEANDDNDPRYWRRIAEGDIDRSMDDRSDENITLDAWDHHTESADDIERWLNDHTPALCQVCRMPVHYDDTTDHWYHGVEPVDNAAPAIGLTHDVIDPATYSWGWHDGEFYLWPTETWEEEG